MEAPHRETADTDTATARRNAEDLATTRAALAGDRAACDGVVQQLVRLPALLRLRNARTGHRLRDDELDDAAQATVLAVWRKLQQYDGRVSLLNWACGFGIVELHRAVERRARRREVQTASEPVATRHESPIDRELLRRAIDELDDDERRAVSLKHFQSMTFAEIATTAGVSVNTIKTRYYRGIERLRLRLGSRSRAEANGV